MFYYFWPHYLWSTYLLEMAKNVFLQEICDGVLCQAAERLERFEDIGGIKPRAIRLRQLVDLCALLYLLPAR